MHQYVNKKVLITTTNWFAAPDGIDYRSVHGTLKSVTEAKNVFGFIPNRAHANWFIEIGKMTIMGCQVLYIIQCNEVEKGETKSYSMHEGVAKEFIKPTAIYITD